MPEAIFEDGPVATPYVYTVTGTGSVTPRACQAVYDGTGAGGSFIPAVIFRSQEGHVIARAILDSTIAAGASAEISWFPGVKHGASTPATGPQAIYGIAALSGNNFGDPPFTVAAGAIANVEFPWWDSNDSGPFSFQPGTPNVDTILLESTDYLYVFHASVRWNSVGFNQQTTIVGPSPFIDGSLITGALDNHGQTPANNFTTGGVFPGDNDWAVDTKTFICDTVPQSVNLQVLHGSVTAKDVGEANLLVIAYKVY